MKYLSAISLSLLLVTAVNAQQEDKQFIDRGLLRAQGNISSGIFSNTGGINMYLHGDLEYYVDKNISIRGESYYFLGTFNANETFKMNHSNFFGAFYHVKTRNRFDPYFGIQPGIAYSQLKPVEILPAMDIDPDKIPNTSYPATFNPLFGAAAGFNYYANKYFHLFAHAKYVTGKHLSDSKPESLNEFKLTFGLGLDLWVIRRSR